jgi:hypothetical protein
MGRINAATGVVERRLKVDNLGESLINKDEYPVRIPLVLCGSVGAHIRQCVCVC